MDHFEVLRRELGLPATLTEAGISRKQLRMDRERLLQAALEDPCCRLPWKIPAVPPTRSR